jgi:hypothetical protein
MTGKSSAARVSVGAAVARPPADGLGRTAMVVGVVAFLGGWLPVLGLILGVIGAVLAIVARRRSNRPELGLTALILSGVAIVTNIVIDIIVIVSIVQGANSL